MKINLNTTLAKNNLVLVFINILILLIFIFTYQDPFNYGILNSFLNRISEVAVLAFGVTIVFIGGGFDLSFPSIMALSSVATAVLYNNGMDFVWAVTIGIISGVVVGLINASLIVSLDLDPFITTFAVSMVVRSMVYGMSGGATFGNFPSWFNNISKVTFFGIPLLFLIMITIAFISHFLVKKTTLGRNIYATGSNEKAAKLSGIKTNNIKFSMYLISGFFSSISGIMIASRVNSAPPNTGLYVGLEVVTAVVVGGTLLSGGVGTIMGSLLAVSVIYMLLTMFNIFGINPFWNITVLGLILIAVVSYSQVFKNIKKIIKVRKIRG
jgi:ribose transport system permease protein